MSVYSMTGYASAAVSAPVQPGAAGAVTVELRSVNSRFLDLVLRLPDELRALEPALREAVSASVRRGKVELRLSTERSGEGALPQPQDDQLALLARAEATVRAHLPEAAALSVHEVLQWCRGSAPAARMDDVALSAARQALERLREAREREGARLVGVLMERVTRLRALAIQAAPLVPALVERQQRRFLERWHEALAATGMASSLSPAQVAERALTEAATFAIRIDVAEELARLNAHLDEITRLLRGGGEVGKRLDFLIQELLREANTLGSKSAALELTQIAVEMKVAIEQLREQVQNIE